MSSIPRRGVCLVIAAPSGAGKTAITRALLAQEHELMVSVSATTRAPRPGERDGVHYHFRDQAAFDAMVAEGALLEWARVFGRSYGTPRAPVEQALTAGRDMVFDIDWQLPALEGRLRARGGDDAAEIARRMAKARDEIAHWSEFEHVIVNDDFEQAVAAVRAVLHAARLATTRQPGLAAFVAGLVKPDSGGE
jgi:guanylate kinase